MRLKSVELYGFKSFPDRTVVEFGDGITAVLGPNGCGKSNIVDAIKWVLGEKSAKNLRGEEMLDVIFSGCESRTAANHAEVKLTFDNSDQLINLPYREVCVERRLNRNKESEYYINKNRCRKKDIRNLFLDTGIGNSAYSVIEQGRVEALLHAKPEERRAVFEEAAGIAKIKVQRKETLSRLDGTDQRLLRINDRVEEKARQIKKVATQAATERGHRELSAERERARTVLYRRQFGRELDLLAELAKQREQLSNQLDQEDRGLTAATTEFTRLSNQEALITIQRDEVVAAAAGVQEEITQVLMRQNNARNRIDSLTQEVNRGNERRAELSARLERLSAQETEICVTLEQAQQAARELEEKFSGQDRERDQLIRAASDSELAVTELRNRMLDVNRERQDTASGLAKLEAAEQSASSRKAEIEGKLERLVAEESGLAQAVAELESQYAQAAERCGQAADRLDTIVKQAADLKAAAERLRSEEQNLTSERASLASRKSALEDLENSFDGAYEGVRNILTAARENHPACRGVVGMAVDLMTVPQDLALAVETILGASAQDVVVESSRDAQDAIEHLKRNRLGRATFLPMDRIQPRRRMVNRLNHIPGVIGEAVDLVTFDQRHRTVMEYLLAGILVVEDLGLARELAGREARGVKIVTLEGDVVSPSGAMTGGHGKQRRAGLVQRKAELDALAEKLVECEKRLRDKSNSRQEVADKVRLLEQETGQIQQSLAEAGRGEAELKQSLALRQAEHARLARDRGEAEAELAGMTEAASTHENELAQARQRLADIDTAIAELSRDIEARTEEQRRHRATLDSLGQEFAQLSGERSAAQARVRELETRLTENRSGQEECRSELDRPGISNAEADAEITSLREELESIARREEALLATRDQTRAPAAALAQKIRECAAEAEALHQRERETQAQIARLREGLALVERKSGESDMRIANLREKAKEELGLDELQAPPRREDKSGQSLFEVQEDGWLTPDSLAPPEEEKAEEEDIFAPFAEITDSDLLARVDELSQKIRNIGHVNPEAIDELAELEAGAEFLRADKEDLEQAVADLHTLLDELNQTTANKFQETFTAVRENFQELFTKLFGGGKADLILEEVTDPDADPLDAGIDIRAQPPGKEPKSISLLSGGEKALCAVALLFALFRSKPSPFCILDEVDGPLDESNIDRFMQQVRDFTDETQFIIITHYQRTMGMTDEIWGVSQMVQGIRSLPSLKFSAMEDMSKDKSAGASEEDTEARSAASA